MLPASGVLEVACLLGRPAGVPAFPPAATAGRKAPGPPAAAAAAAMAASSALCRAGEHVPAVLLQPAAAAADSVDECRLQHSHQSQPEGQQRCWQSASLRMRGVQLQPPAVLPLALSNPPGQHQMAHTASGSDRLLLLLLFLLEALQPAEHCQHC